MYDRCRKVHKGRLSYSQNPIDNVYHVKDTKTLPGDSSSKDEKNNEENIRALPFKIPMAYVVSEAREVCSQAKCVKKMEQLERAQQVAKSLIKGTRDRSNDRTLIDMSSTFVGGNKMRKSNQETDGHRTPWFQDQENNEIKRPRRQAKVSQQTRGRKTSSVKRRPLLTSNQEIWFANRDTTAAIINSRIVAKRVMNATKGKANLGSAISQMKKGTKPKHRIDNVPRFSSIPNEFEELCRNKSVEEVTSTKLSRKDFSEFHKRKPTYGIRSEVSFAIRGMSQPVCKLRNVNEAATPTDTSTIQQSGLKKQGFSNHESSCHSQFVRTCGVVENIRVPKNIYIRKETGGEFIEDLVEVRNQDDLDVLNTLTALKSVKNKYEVTESVMYFEDLRDYETYYYPVSKPSSRRSQVI